MAIDRRTFLGVSGAALCASVALFVGGRKVEAQRDSFPFRLSDADWRRRLNAQQYAVLRGHATERAGTSPLDREHRRGTFHCAGCGHPLFSSTTKFDSGTGWPSFFRPLPRAVGTSTDRSLGVARTEVHCARCGGHLGHVYPDGPPPTGQRYCMNGVAMIFRAA
jgi:peptide-methionine (R)-S-oxide reductase